MKFCCYLVVTIALSASTVRLGTLGRYSINDIILIDYNSQNINSPIFQVISRASYKYCKQLEKSSRYSQGMRSIEQTRMTVFA
jgi:hypothetical protein